MNNQEPPRALPEETRAVLVSKQLSDFIQAYNKDIQMHKNPSESAMKQDVCILLQLNLLL